MATGRIRENEWQLRMARDRMTGYLDALGVPPVEAIEMISEVFSEVCHRNQTLDSINPLQEAMQILRRRLGEQKRIKADNLMDFADAESLRRPLPPAKQGRMGSDVPDGVLGDGMFKRMLKKGLLIHPFCLLSFRTP